MATLDVKADITGNVWKIVTKVGDTVAEDAPLMILESMKMEIPVPAPEGGTVLEILVSEGATVAEGMVLARLSV